MLPRKKKMENNEKTDREYENQAAAAQCCYNRLAAAAIIEKVTEVHQWLLFILKRRSDVIIGDVSTAQQVVRFSHSTQRYLLANWEGNIKEDDGQFVLQRVNEKNVPQVYWEADIKNMWMRVDDNQQCIILYRADSKHELRTYVRLLFCSIMDTDRIQDL